MSAGIGQSTGLSNRRSLQVCRAPVGKKIVARIVVVGVAAHIRSQVEDSEIVEHARVCRRYIKGPNLRTLVGIPDIPKDRSGRNSIADYILDVEIVIGIRRLKPRPAVVQIEMDGVLCRESAVDAVEDIFLVALDMKDAELGRIQEFARI